MPEEPTQVSNSRESKLLTGYREMANDDEREAEALEWCEGLIADVARVESDCGRHTFTAYQARSIVRDKG